MKTTTKAQTAPRHDHRWQIAKRTCAGLRGTPLGASCWQIEAEAYRWNISPFLIAGIAGTESGFGAAACDGNAWGIASCGIRFASFGDGARYTARLLRREYLNDGLTSLEEVGTRYAACGSCWADATAGHMRRFGANRGWLKYPS